MSRGDPSGALRDIRTLFNDGMLGGLTDRQLLERFVNRNDASAEDAFAILLERHGPMVWGVCRRLLTDRDAAADAFQATFLVLLRKARAVRVEGSFGPWLHGVSRRVAMRLRATSLRRRAREIGGVETVAGPTADPEHAERLGILDEEIGRLPERERTTVVLCDLEGLPHEQAAVRLGCPVGTVESRLSRARQRLRDRLIRRGLAPAAAAIWAEMAREAAAAMPAVLIKESVRFVTSSHASGTVPVAVTALAEGVIKMMWLSRLKPVVVVAAALVVASVGVVVHGRQQPAPSGALEQAKIAPPPAGGSGAPAASDLAANQALAREQLSLIDQALAALHSLARKPRSESSSFADPSFSLWERRKLDALHSAGAGKAEIVAALEKLIDTLKQEEPMAEARHKAARGTQLEILDVRYRRMQAEIWLNEEKAR